MLSYAYCRKNVWQVVFTNQPRTNYPGVSPFCNLNLQERIAFPDRAGQVSFHLSIFYYRGYAAAHHPEVIIIPHDKSGTLVLTQEIKQLTFSLFNPFNSAKTFEVRLAGICNNAMCWKRIGAV